LISKIWDDVEIVSTTRKENPMKHLAPPFVVLAVLIVTHQFTGPAKATRETENWQGDLRNAAQLALGSVVGGVAVKALLHRRREHEPEDEAS
jgi:hypothetical protein